MDVILKDLPKISLNKWYSGTHWTKRKKLKDTYTLLVNSQFKDVLSKENKYKVDYIFHFKTRPLDASNCVAMVKMIEDIMFEDDKYNIVLKLTIESKKAKEDFVEIKINVIQ